MKKTIPKSVRSTLLAATILPASAGDFGPIIPDTGSSISTSGAGFDWFQPSVNLRTRYEFRDQEDLNDSNAVTARLRAGLKLGDFHGFSAFGEFEGTAVPSSSFRSNPTGNASTFPFNADRTPIADPRNAELNQLYLQYAKDGFLLKGGRQRIIRNNSAFIGNVGWRQNEQTFDAAQIGYKTEQFGISYVYSDRVQRIFGEESNDGPPGPPLRDFEGDFHIIDGWVDAGFGKLSGYAYLLDVENNANVGESNTYGLYTKVDGLYLEAAFQEGNSNIGGDYDALYAHVKYTHSVGKTKLIAAVEYLEDDFKTPFGTVHAFNGFADAFVLDRIGLRNGPGGTYDGLTDIYLGLVQPGLPLGITFKGFLHYFADDSLDETYGYEADMVLVKKFNKNLSGLLKAAYFVADDDAAYSDIQQVSVQLDYKF